MIVKTDMYLAHDFKFWAGAVAHVDAMTTSQISAVEDELDSLYPDGMTAKDINDTFWFETDFLAECNGFDSWDEMMDFNNSEN